MPEPRTVGRRQGARRFSRNVLLALTGAILPVALGCAAPGGPGIMDLVAAQEPVAARVTLVFNPASCTLTTAEIAPLNLLAQEYGIEVTAISVVPLDTVGEVATIQDKFGIRFPIMNDPGGQWAEGLTNDGLSQPAILVEKRGVLQALILRDGAQRLAPLLSTMFGVNLVPGDEDLNVRVDD